MNLVSGQKADPDSRLSGRQLALDIVVHHEQAGPKPIRVPAPAAELVLATAAIASVDFHCRSARAEHSSHDGPLAVPEHELYRFIAAIGGRDCCCGSVCHESPTGRGISTAHFLP